MSSPINVPNLLSRLVLLDEPETGYLVLVRHGEARDPDDPEAATREDPPLTARGQQQAEAVARRLSERTIHAAYTSPLARARQTGQAVGEALERPVREKEDLREIDVDREAAIRALEEGSWEPSTGPEPGSSPAAFRWSDLSYVEEREAFRRRVNRAFDEIVEDHPGETVVVTTHTGVINVFLSQCLGFDSDFWVLPAHTGISTVRTLGSRRAVVTVNDYAHLRQ